MKTITREVYDNKGLAYTELIEVDEAPLEQLIVEKETQLLELYEELKKLKESL